MHFFTQTFFVYHVVYFPIPCPSALYQLLGVSEITANLYCNCSISVLGRLRDLQYIFAVTYWAPSSYMFVCFFSVCISLSLYLSMLYGWFVLVLSVVKNPRIRQSNSDFSQKMQFQHFSIFSISKSDIYGWKISTLNS